MYHYSECDTQSVYIDVDSFIAFLLDVFLKHVFTEDCLSGLYTCCRLVEQCNLTCLLQMFALVYMTGSIPEFVY